MNPFPAVAETIRREQLAGVARIYANNAAASRALGPAFRTFTRLCRRYGVTPPPAVRAPPRQAP